MSANPAIISLGTGMLLPQNNRIGVNDFVVHTASAEGSIRIIRLRYSASTNVHQAHFRKSYVCSDIAANCGQLVS